MHLGDSVTVTVDGLMGMGKVWLLPLMLQVCTITVLVVGSIIVVVMTLSFGIGCVSIASNFAQ